MSKRFFSIFVPAVILLMILYEIWPLPFWLLSNDVILPTTAKISEGFRLAVSPLSVLKNIGNLDKENKNLQNENSGLKAQIAKINNDITVGQKMSEEGKLSGAFAWSKVARIIGRTPQSYSENLVIDQGSNDSIAEGQAVISNGYLIGRISKVQANSSEVHLITNHDSMIPALLSSSRESGLVQGGLEGLTLNEIPSNSQITIGDKVITSGLGGDIPSGIIIGEVYQKANSSQGLFQSYKINYPINISSLEVVSVVK